MVDTTNLIRAQVTEFFEKQENVEQILPIINRVSRVSLRLLDYFCVNYTRDKMVGYMVDGRYFDVHSSYKIQLKTFSKKLFDPFKRHLRFRLKYKLGTVETTLGQLCFFKWCIKNQVLYYVSQHIDAITDHMKRTLTQPGYINTVETSKNKKAATRKRRSAITVTATRMQSPLGTDRVILYFE